MEVLIREEGRSELLELLELLRGRKCLILDIQLGRLLNQIILEGSKLLKENGVQYIRELTDESIDFINESGRDIPDNIVYLVRPDLPSMKIIAKQVQACLRAGIRTQYHVYFVPHRTVVCEQLLEDEGVLTHLEIGEFHLGLIPLDGDLYSLEIDGAFKQCYVDGDTSYLHAAARSLCKLQNLVGVIPNIKSKGVLSRKVIQKLMRLRREDDNNISRNGYEMGHHHREIDTLVVIDRDVDLISPLVTPLTYEGLIDEIIGIENGRIKIDPCLLGEDKGDDPSGGVGSNAVAGSNATTGVTNQASSSSSSSSNKGQTKGGVPPGEKVPISLSNNDPVFAEIRDLSIERLGSFLQEKAISIKEKYASFRDNKDASISEIHGFVKKIPMLTNEYKALTQHINLAEVLKQTTDSRDFREVWQYERGILEGETHVDEIEDLICADTDRSQFFKAMRLLCLQSLTSGGIRSNKYDSIKRAIIQTYGYEHLFTLCSLEKCGILKRKDLLLVEGLSPWHGLKKPFRLIDDRVNDISYVAAGYAPLSIRLLQILGSGSWTAASEIIKQLPGPLLEFSQQDSVAEELSDALKREGGSGGGNNNNNDASAIGNSFYSEDTKTKKVLFFFVIGGLSFLEIASCRYLSKDPTFPFKIIMASDSILSLKKSLYT